MSATPIPPPTLRRVALVAVATRVAYLAEHARSPFFTAPVLDGKYFELFARALARGESPAGLATGFRPALYPLLLAPLFRLFGDAAIVVAQLLQHAAGVATALAVALLARRLFRDERAALAAGVLYALAGPPLFLEGELLVESLFVAGTALFLLLAIPPDDGDGDRARRALAAGIVLALSAQLRPNALLLLAALPLRLASRRARRAALALAGGALAGLVLVAALAAPLTGAFRLLPGAGGVNFYLGNERRADGLVPRQDFAVSYGEAYRDSVEVFAEEGFRRATGAAPESTLDRDALSRWWLRRGLAEIAADPGRWLALEGRKAAALVWNGEVPNNRAYAFAARAESRWLRWTPVGFGFLFALALAGVARAPAGAARFWLSAFALTHAAGVLLFFVADRYRLPLVLPAAVFAGGGVVALVDAFARRDVRAALRPLLLLGLGALASFPDWSGARARLPGAERDLLFRSIAWSERGESAAALADARAAFRLAPGDGPTALQLARAALAADALGEARTALGAARRLAPAEPRVENLAGVVAERDGDLAAAYRHYRRAVELEPLYAPAQVNAAWLEARAGRFDLAGARHWALAAGEPTAQGLLLEAALARAEGNTDAAAALERRAEVLAPDASRRLREELARRIPLPAVNE